MHTLIPHPYQPAPSHTARKPLPRCVQIPLVMLASIAALLAIQSCTHKPAAQKSTAQTSSKPAAATPSQPPASAAARASATTSSKPQVPATSQASAPASATPSASTSSKPATPASLKPTASVRKSVHRRKRPSIARAALMVQPAPVTPPTPEPPHSPINDRPGEASVIWDSHGLLIAAQNSSLKQIMNDVSTVTGTKIEGLSTDQRVFGAYGPGKAREVLSKLLEGTDYNVLMIGDQGGGTPRQIVLSTRGGATTPPPANANNMPAPIEEEEASPDENPDESNPRRPNRHGNFEPGGHTPPPPPF